MGNEATSDVLVGRNRRLIAEAAELTRVQQSWSGCAARKSRTVSCLR